VKLVAFFALVAGCNLSAYCAPVYFCYEDNFNLPIPQDPDFSKGWMADAVINIPDHHIIKDLDIEVNITHTNVFDLQLFLVSPAGTTVCLNKYTIPEFFIKANYIDTIFDDQATLSIKQGQAPFTGRYHPLNPLNVFNGQDTFGLWQLRIYDAYYSDRGKLDSYGLFVSGVPEPSTFLILVMGAVFAKLCRIGKS
jgi:subtilisin-like proprotein convertase family protein